MGTGKFVHLHTHTEFSLLDGACRIKDLVKKAVEFEMPSLAITDHGVMYGNITFYSEAKSQGIKPILGCEVYVAPRSRTQRDPRLDKEQYHLVLLAKNENGYKNLIKLVSIAYSEGFYYKPRVDKELLSHYGQDLIAMTACIGGEVPSHILNKDFTAAERSLGEYIEIFGKDNLYLELQDNGLPEQKIANEALVELSRKTGLKLTATNDIHYLTRKDAEAHDVLLCIQTGSTLDDPKRMRFGTDQFYMKSRDEMAAVFKDYPESLDNTLEVAERCNIEFDFGRSMLPDPGLPPGADVSEYMRTEAHEGLKKRLGGSIPEEYDKQLEYECKVISDCGFPMYMLIVRDFTDYAHTADIFTGVRGSAAGSIVCYGLGITDVDPIEYGLTFERFLNPERLEMPDIDLDIQDDRRDDLIGYVCDKYGRDRVGQIATFGSLKARAAVRDCGRVLGMDLGEVDRVCKMIPTIPVGITIEQAFEENPDFKKAYDGSGQVKKLLDTAKKLEGINRNVGVHAAGVLICADPLTDHVPVHQGGKGEFVAQLAKKDIAKVGLLKMDFLGLANLTILAEAVKNVEKNRGIEIDIMNIPLDDKKTYEMLGQGDTNGVFQLEGAGMRRNVIELQPGSVRELAAIVALYRPGPMAHIPKFVKSKFGQEPIKYLHKALEPILSETYGVICYQDQVLRIAQAIAGFSLGQADVLRKAMSSKDKVIMEKQREKFLEGAKNNGIDSRTAEKIYEQIEPFAGYAFNKAHAVCYAFVAYRTAYMKANYPVEYYTALLSANMDVLDKLSIYIEDCKRLNIDIFQPDINFSGVKFEVEGDGIRFGLGAVKGCGRAIIESMVEARDSGGKFIDLFDFCERVPGINKGTLECLIKVGAFSSINGNRAQLLEMLPDALAAAAVKQRDQKSGQTGLFGGDEAELASASNLRKYDHISDFKPEQLYSMEKDLVGLYLSGHPLENLRGVLETNCTATGNNYKELEHDQECTIGGIVVEVREKITRRNDKMAFVRIEDLLGTIPVTFFPDSYKSAQQYLAVDRVVFIKGKATHRERIAANEDDTVVEVEIRGESVQPYKNGAVKSNGNGNRGVHIKINGAPDVQFEVLRSLLEAHPGESPVFLHLCHNGCRKKVLVPFRVTASAQFVDAVEKLIGSGVVKLV